jgi:hypothetical protein
MVKFFRELYFRFFPLTEKSALKIAIKHASKPRPILHEDFKIDEVAKDKIYCPGDKESFWAIRCPWNDGFEGKMLRDGRVILVSKVTGKVIYDGSAGEE